MRIFGTFFRIFLLDVHGISIFLVTDCDNYKHLFLNQSKKLKTYLKFFFLIYTKIKVTSALKKLDISYNIVMSRMVSIDDIDIVYGIHDLYDNYPIYLYESSVTLMQEA